MCIRDSIIAAISRSLNGPERRYSPYEGEALAVVWATTMFRPYVYGQPLTIVSDHRPLQFVLRNTELSGKFARWAALLQDLDLKIVHRPGSQQPADHLSRYPLPSTTDVTGARDTDLDEDDSHAESTLVHTVDLNTLHTHLLQSVTQYGVTPVSYTHLTLPTN